MMRQLFDATLDRILAGIFLVLIGTVVGVVALTAIAGFMILLAGILATPGS